MNARYRRGDWYTVRVPDPIGGSVAKSARTRDQAVAKAMERMLADMYDRPKYHPILRQMLPRKGLKLPHVYAAWVSGTIDQLLASLSDRDLSPLVSEWEKHLESRFGTYGYVQTETYAKREGETAHQYVRQVRALIEHAGGKLLQSRLTPALVSPWLAGLHVKTGTRRRYYIAVREFASYLVLIGVLPTNPLVDMKAPPQGKPRDRHLSKAEWLRLIDAHKEPYRTASVLAHLGIELGVIPEITRRDVDLKARTVHAKGTKRPWRDRFCYIYDWALPYLTTSCRHLMPDARLVERGPDTIRAAHDEVTERLKIKDYRFHDARHSVAVWLCSAGTPFEVVASQLGHKDTRMVSTVYGRFKPNTSDAARWARAAELRDKEIIQEAK